MTIDNFLAEAAEVFAELDSNIESLQAHVTELHIQIAAQGDSFTVDSTRRNLALQTELEQMRDTLNRAKEHRAQLVKEFTRKVRAEASAIVAEGFNRFYEIHADDMDGLTEAIEKARQCAVRLKESENAAKKNYYAQVYKLAPYISHDEMSKLQSGIMWSHTGNNLLHRNRSGIESQIINLLGKA